jgi:hypothetical protein
MDEPEIELGSQLSVGGLGVPRGITINPEKWRAVFLNNTYQYEDQQLDARVTDRLGYVKLSPSERGISIDTTIADSPAWGSVIRHSRYILPIDLC